MTVGHSDCFSSPTLIDDQLDHQPVQNERRVNGASPGLHRAPKFRVVEAEMEALQRTHVARYEVEEPTKGAWSIVRIVIRNGVETVTRMPGVFRSHGVAFQVVSRLPRLKPSRR